MSVQDKIETLRTRERTAKWFNPSANFVISGEEAFEIIDDLTRRLEIAKQFVESFLRADEPLYALIAMDGETGVMTAEQVVKQCDIN